MLATLLGIMIIFFSRILFTDKIIRAPDIINEYYWSVLNLSSQPLSDIFHIILTAKWDIYNNSGNTLEGGGLGNQFLIWQKLLYHAIKPPVSVAWFIRVSRLTRPGRFASAGKTAGVPKPSVWVGTSPL